MADAGLRRGLLEDVGAVPFAFHPALDGAEGIGQARRDVLRREAVAIPRALKPRIETRAVAALMAEKVARRHVLRMRLRGCSQACIEGEGREPVLRALPVDACEKRR